MTPRLTVLMPVRNRVEFLDEAIRSVVEQDFTDFEFVIVDDASTDTVPDVLRAWAARDPRIVVITAPQHLGIADAPNLGLRHARAEFIARLDSDDVMSPGRLTAQLAVLESRPDVVLVTSAYELIDRHGNHLDTWRKEEPHEVVTWILHFYNIIGGGGHVMYRRADVLAEDGYDAALAGSEDYDLWVRLLRRGRIVMLPMIGMRQREHDRRSSIGLAQRKHANWTSITRKSLAPYLEREISSDEIDALITVWRHDGKRGMAPRADRIMREAFARFRREHASRDLRARVRHRVARRWMAGARFFARAGHRAEALRYVIRALRWSPIDVWRWWRDAS